MKDKFTKKALSEGYFARSIYKLKDIQKRFRIIRRGDEVLDLGAAPGAWSQFVLELGAHVDSVDLNEVKRGNFIKFDVMSEDLFEELDKEYDVVLSDLAPKTIGVRSLDSEISFDLAERALVIAKEVLKVNGRFVCKIFESEFTKRFVNDCKNTFKIVKVVKPMASKKRSKEMYIVGLKKM